ncbi:hypothetical protein CALVIDRAFT_61943 [Calocera viscosa TUFC12733]|uniref:Uncharacterized protein n=1 Tax=Calocera viscosa (strain TUFC12733) TaxID=1330018 RepID=A0A167NLX7_CALVF|nr:hypothetical protein CALVIDRAFT_61943 [Calocera viscosa TUFC12733]
MRCHPLVERCWGGWGRSHLLYARWTGRGTGGEGRGSSGSGEEEEWEREGPRSERTIGAVRGAWRLLPLCCLTRFPFCSRQQIQRGRLVLSLHPYARQPMQQEGRVAFLPPPSEMFHFLLPHSPINNHNESQQLPAATSNPHHRPAPL